LHETVVDHAAVARLLHRAASAKETGTPADPEYWPAWQLLAPHTTVVFSALAADPAARDGAVQAGANAAQMAACCFQGEPGLPASAQPVHHPHPRPARSGQVRESSRPRNGMGCKADARTLTASWTAGRRSARPAVLVRGQFSRASGADPAGEARYLDYEPIDETERGAPGYLLSEAGLVVRADQLAVDWACRARHGALAKADPETDNWPRTRPPAGQPAADPGDQLLGRPPRRAARSRYGRPTAEDQPDTALRRA
jgi:hypothetical protein